MASFTVTVTPDTQEELCRAQMVSTCKSRNRLLVSTVSMKMSGAAASSHLYLSIAHTHTHTHCFMKQTEPFDLHKAACCLVTGYLIPSVHQLTCQGGVIFQSSLSSIFNFLCVRILGLVVFFSCSSFVFSMPSVSVGFHVKKK